MRPEVITLMNALREVIDFEIGLDVVSLGMIRNVELGEDTVKITMILTSPMCPLASMIMQQVYDKAVEVMPDRTVEVVLGQEYWTPDMMEPEARAALGIE